MKKLSKMAAILASVALLFGAVSCSSDDDSGNGSGPDTGNGGEQQTQLPEITANFTYHWDFSNAPAVAAGSAVNEQLSAKKKTPETAYDLKLLLKGSTFNGVKPTQTLGESSQTAIYGKATVGAIEPNVGDEVSVEIKGPFKATMYCSSNASNDKEDRYARIMVGEKEFCNAAEKSANKLPAAGTIVVAADDGAGLRTVKFGGTNITRIYDIIIETTVDQTPSANDFTATKYTFTPEDIDKIKLAGEITGVTSSNENIVKVTDDGASITSVAAGDAEISITDGTYTAKVAVTVRPSGTISIGTVTNPFILDTTSKTFELTEEATGLASYASAEGETGVTASVSGSTLTYSVSGLTEACTKKITLKDESNNEAEVTVTVGALGEVSARVSMKYVDSNVTPDWYLGTVDKNAKTSSTSTNKATFTSKSVTLNGSTMIVLSDVTVASGKKVVLTFDVPAATFSSDAGTGNVYGGLMESDGAGNSTTYAVYVSSKGISNGSKNMQNGGSSNGFGTTKLSKVKVDDADTAVELKEGTFVTYKLEYTVGADGNGKKDNKDVKDGSLVVLTASVTGTVKDATETTTDTKEVKGKEVKWCGSVANPTPNTLPLIPFIGNVGKSEVTISNITLTIDDAPVVTSASK